jgi:dTDP-4-amino-4,6-dideoxygalactose transaminase
MRIPMTDLTAQYILIKKEVDLSIQRVLESGRYILGPEVEAFEKELADYCGTKFAVGVASGTDALILGLLSCGIKPGDEVITTPFTFIATVEAITHCGAKPVFVDIDPVTYNLDPQLIESCITSQTKAIIPVHLFGQPADMGPIMDIARRHNLKVIEDCAQALSSEYKGQKAGAIGNAGCLSFFPSKNLGAYGDAGAVVTNDSQVAEMVQLLRQHGTKTTYVHLLPGYNSRLDVLHASILRIKLKHLDKWSFLRREKSALYTQLLNQIDSIETPNISEDRLISANYYTIRMHNHQLIRSELRQCLSSKGIETAVYYPLSLHLQEAYRSLGYKPGDFPQSELAQEQVLSLPMYPEIEQEQIIEIVDTIKEFFKSRCMPLAKSLSS